MPRSTVMAASICLLALLSLGGCQRSYRIERGASDVNHMQDGLTEYNSAVRIYVGNTLIGELSVKSPQLTVARSLVPHDQNGHPELIAEMETPCGWQQVGVRAEEDWGTVRVYRAGWPGPELRALSIWYDNRGGGATEVRVGQQSLTLLPNSSGRMNLVTTGCQGEGEVKVGEKPAGSVPWGDWNDRPRYVLDAAGGHCYTYQTVQYGSGPGSYPPENLSGQRLYDLGEDVQDIGFLKKPPEEISAEQSSALLYYLWESECPLQSR